MNLEDITDGQTTTKKMRLALRSKDNIMKKTKELSKKKNANPDASSVEPMDGPSDVSDTVDATTAFTEV